jgi:6-phosphogluconolactonase/glucosamine-6-phosphate isomerase/deaminase
MKIFTEKEPAMKVGEYVTKLTAKHNGDVFFLLSGGSALDVVYYLNPTPPSGGVDKDKKHSEIFMMVDERFSSDPSVNNSLQLKNRYPHHNLTQKLIMSVPEPDQSNLDFANSLGKILTQTITKLDNPLIIALLGIGTDGHTAGIFPLPEESFGDIYKDDSVYVPVHIKGLKIDSRASCTPSWILTQVDHVVGYIVGDTKTAVLQSLINESKPIHERPAELIKRHQDAVIYTDICI